MTARTLSPTSSSSLQHHLMMSSGIDTEEEYPVRPSRYHHRPQLSLDLSLLAMMTVAEADGNKSSSKQYTYDHSRHSKLQVGTHRRWGSASAVRSDGISYIPQPYQLRSDNDDNVADNAVWIRPLQKPVGLGEQHLSCDDVPSCDSNNHACSTNASTNDSRKPLPGALSHGNIQEQEEKTQTRRQMQVEFKEEEMGPTLTKTVSGAFTEMTTSTRAASSSGDLSLSSIATTRRKKQTSARRQRRRKSTGSETVIIRPLQGFLRTVSSAVESLQKRHRRSCRERKISEALLTLRAAAELKQQQEEQQQHVPRAPDLAGIDTTSMETALFSPLGTPMGSVLFSPLSPNFFAFHEQVQPESEDLTLQRQEEQQQSTIVSSMEHISVPLSTTSTTVQKEHYQVQIAEETPESLLANPRILSQAMFQQLMDEGIPECLHMNQWGRIFSIDRDGDSFRNMLDHCQGYQYTLLAIRTTTGHILGGFASDPWQEQDGYSARHSYYGKGLSFLFANHPMLEEDGVDDDGDDDDTKDDCRPSKELVIFPWTGLNDFCQICDLDRKVIAMGGSGAFGLILEDDFYVGSTDRCGTFGNPPLIPDKDGIFAVESMEIYGLAPYWSSTASLLLSATSPNCIGQFFEPKSSNSTTSVLERGTCFGNFRK